MEILDENSVIEVTEKGIAYVGSNGEREFIDFAACYEQYLESWSDPARLEQVKQVNNMDDARLRRFLERIKLRKEVGSRNVLELPWADGPYIEFYTEPVIRFRFTSADEYMKTRNKIEDAGWQTTDQS